MTVRICCESAPCNAGHSAADREAAVMSQLPNVTAEMRDEAEKHARGLVSRKLAVTPHTRRGTDHRGASLYACTACGHERVYGHAMWQA